MLIIGNYISPYARKVLLALQIKGIAFELDPIVPYFGNDEFTRLSPLRRIPVLVDGDLVLNDSTVIGEYLDEAYPEPPLFPKNPRERPRPLDRGVLRQPHGRNHHLEAVLSTGAWPAHLEATHRRGAGGAGRGHRVAADHGLAGG